MKNVILFVLLLFMAISLSACGAAKMTRVNMNTGEVLGEGERCPVGDTCLADFNSGDSLPGGGIGRAMTLGSEGDCIVTNPQGVPLRDQNGNFYMEKCKQASIAAGFNPGHFDVIIPTAVNGAFMLGGKFIDKAASDNRSDALRDQGPSEITYNIPQSFSSAGASAGASSNPAILNLNDNDAAAISQQETGVGISTSQKTGGSCPTCYDPR